jgi:DNA-binding NtrC family response regulator
MPLRAAERRTDITLLTHYFIRTSTVCPEKSQRLNSISTLAMEQLLQHDWPGNVRELRNVIDRAILLETTDKIGLESIVIDAELFLQMCDHVREDKVKDFSLEKAEKELIAKALQETNGQKTKAAELLGISRATLYSKVKQHSIENNAIDAVEPCIETSSASSVNSPVLVA